MRLFYDDEYDALRTMIGESGKPFKECAQFLFPDMKPESAYAKLKACLDGGEKLSLGQAVALMKFCGSYDPLMWMCDETLHQRPEQKAPEDHEQKIVSVIENAAHTMQRAMQELNQFRRIRGVA